MITPCADGAAHVAQVGVGIVTAPDGTERLWSSGTRGRLRTRHLRRDPRCTLFVFDPPARWLGVEATVTILDGPEAAALHPLLYRAVLGLEPGEKIRWGDNKAADEEIVAMAAAEERLIYDFQITRAYGRPAT